MPQAAARLDARTLVLQTLDAANSPGSTETRRFTAKYDVDGAASQRWRDRLMAEAAAEGHLLLFYHGTDTYAAFVDAAPKGGWRVEPVAV